MYTGQSKLHTKRTIATATATTVAATAIAATAAAVTAATSVAAAAVAAAVATRVLLLRQADVQHAAAVGPGLAMVPAGRRGGSKGVLEGHGGIALEHAGGLVTVQPDLYDVESQGDG